MLLRRITKHVREQNWFAVFIDFVIVVVGVFIGIQVANWNEASTTAKREQDILAAISKDLVTDQKVMTTGIEMAKLNIKVGNYLLAKAELAPVTRVTLPVPAGVVLSKSELTSTVPDSLPDDVLKDIWKHVAFRYHPTQSNAAFNSLVTAGDLTIISDKALASELLQYNQAWQSMGGSQDLTFRVFRNQLVFIGQEFGLSPFLPSDEQELIEIMQNNPKFTGALRTMTEYAILHEEIISNIYKKNQQLSAQINLLIELKE